MTPKLAWLDDPNVFRVNELPAHSDHHVYQNETEAKAGVSSYLFSLNGYWDFHFAQNPQGRLLANWDFETVPTTTAKINVPGEIEIQNFGQNHYINTLYPWSGKIYRRPPYSLPGQGIDEGTFSHGEDNTVGTYIKHFDRPAGWDNYDIHLRFDGVERAMYVWLNGYFVGYAEDSFTPSEFDLTPYLKATDNVLIVEVFKHSTASWLEDQDMFRFSGIFRDVNLVAIPAAHVTDVKLEPFYDAKSGQGRFGVQLQVENPAAMAEITLIQPDGKVALEKIISAKDDWKLSPVFLGAVKAWSNHQPTLYQLEITLTVGKEIIEFIPMEVGFREVKISDDHVLMLNGERLIINGVNRHEWNCDTGRTISHADMEQDLQTMLDNNINAVRTCHYPDQSAWYELCDEAGIYVMSEVNLESHGTWQKMGAIEPSDNIPGSIPEWLAPVMDRAKTNYEVLKNHPSILFWSLGNESDAGEDFVKMNEFYKRVDPSRLVHYESVFYAPDFRDRISDFESRMYLPAPEAAEYLANHPDKPFIECEYMHSMGNSVGGLKSYIDLIDQYPQYCGGFIWDFIDQAIRVTDPITGQKVMRYGGDFDDRHADYEFSGDGLMFADRTPKPAMQEVKYYYGLHK